MIEGFQWRETGRYAMGTSRNTTSTTWIEITVGGLLLLALGSAPAQAQYSLSPASLSGGNVCAHYSQTISASPAPPLGNTAWAYTISVGTPPAGLALSTTSGVLSGWPATQGTSSFTVVATSCYPGLCMYPQYSITASRSYTVTIGAQLPSLTVNPVSIISAGAVCSTYAQRFTATGGSGSYRYSHSGALPPGLILASTTGILSGTPTVAGTYSFWIEATDTMGLDLPIQCYLFGRRRYSLTIQEMLLTVQKGGNGSGTVTSSPPGIACDPVCLLASGPFGCSDAVTLTAAPSPDSTFAGWSGGGCSGTSPCILTMTQPTTVTATFVKGATATLTGTASICSGGSAPLNVTLTGTPPWSLTWSDGRTDSGIAASPLTRQVSPGTTTTYSITSVRDASTTGTASGTAAVTVTSAPGAPTGAVILATGATSGTSHINGIDPVTFSWGLPASGAAVTRFQYNINQAAWVTPSPATSTSVNVAPLRKSDPVTLYVQAFGCSPEQAGPMAASATVSFAPPSAGFSFPASISAGTAVPFTDTSSPQATDWFWIFGDDGSTSSSQAVSHTFRNSGTYKVALIATNGSGSTSRVQDVVVNVSTRVTPGGAATRAFVEGPDGVLALEPVEIEAGSRRHWLFVSNATGERLTAFLRARAADGTSIVERRLVLDPYQDAEFDLDALLPEGSFRLEFASPPALTPTLLERRPGRLQTGARRQR